MPLPHPIPAELAERVARRFKALGEPTRIAIVDRLREGEQPVGELAGQVGTSQQNVSKHLALLHQEGVVARRREGNRSLYRIADPEVLALCEHVCGGIERELERTGRLLSGRAA